MSDGALPDAPAPGAAAQSRPGCPTPSAREGRERMPALSPARRHLGALAVALLLDAAFGEPPAAQHPVVWIGSYRIRHLVPA